MSVIKNFKNLAVMAATFFTVSAANANSVVEIIIEKPAGSWWQSVNVSEPILPTSTTVTSYGFFNGIVPSSYAQIADRIQQLSSDQACTIENEFVPQTESLLLITCRMPASASNELMIAVSLLNGVYDFGRTDILNETIDLTKTSGTLTSGNIKLIYEVK